MTRDLLVRGMLVGVVAGLLSFGFLKVFGEPQVDRAITFETQMDEAKTEAKVKADLGKGIITPKEEPEPEIFSRSVQSGVGLLTGVTVYSAAFGGMFALAFAFAYGRLGNLGARATSALLAGAALISIYIVPNMKYPANPPSVGEPETIRIRTILYFAMIAVSIAAMVGAIMLRSRLMRRLGTWDASIAAGLAWFAFVLVVSFALPAVNEVPEGFPAVVLWQFRVASWGAQLILWTTLGLGFGALTERAAISRRSLAIAGGRDLGRMIRP